MSDEVVSSLNLFIWFINWFLVVYMLAYERQKIINKCNKATLRKEINNANTNIRSLD